MKIKNIGRKIIGFGQTSVLPDETAHIPDSFKDVVLDTYVALGIVSIIEPAKDKGETKTDKGGKTDKCGKTDKGGKTDGKGGKTENTETTENTDTDEETEAGKE